MAKYNVHAGHNPSGRVACGAVGILDESKENRLIAKEMVRLLKLNSQTVYDCTVDNGTSAGDVLKKIVEKCDSHKVQGDYSIHLNSGRKDKEGDGSIGGFEVLVTSTANGKGEVAKRIRKNMTALGFKDRGTKIRNDLYVLNKTDAPAFILEICFVDDKDDAELYKAVGYKKIAQAIVKGILNKTSIKTSAEPVFNPYMVKITTKTLNVRAGAGTNHKVTCQVKKDEVFTIAGEKMNGKTKWLQLKSGKGFISANYTKKL